MKRIQLYGRSTKDGLPSISGKERFDEFFRSNPNTRFFMEISCIEPSNIFHHIWYIMKMIVPAFIEGSKEKGILLTPKEALEEIIEACPIFYKSETERHTIFDWKMYQPYTELSKEELEMGIEWLHYYCLENFNLSIGNYKSI